MPLSADAAAATSAMVSASAPSVYSVQALSLLAEVSTRLPRHPRWGNEASRGRVHS